VAVPVTVSVNTLDPVAGFVANAAVTPLGRPEAASVTLPVNPFAPVTLIVSVPLPPCTTESVAAVGASVKLGDRFTVSAIVVEAVTLPEVPVIVTVDVPVVAVAAAVNVTTLDPVAGFVPKLAVTPAGRPVAASVTLPVNPFAPVTLTVSVAVLPCTTETLAAVGASVKLGDRFTVNAIVVEAVRVPDVPVIVTVAAPVTAVAVAVNVTTLDPVVGFVAKLAVTPVGNPVAASVTLPVNPFAPVTFTVSVAVLPCTTETLGAVGATVKLAGEFTVNAIVVEAVKLPDVPVIVTVAGPVVAVPVAVNVTTLDPVVGFVANAAVTPLGSPVAASVTLPVNPFAPVTFTVSVELLPWTTETVAAVGASVKLGGKFTVSVTVVDAVRLPEVPVIVTVAGPVVAVPLAVSVSVLPPVVGFVPNVAVTPLGSPVAASVTLPLNPFAPVTLIVSVVLLPCVTESVAVVGASVNVGAAPTAKLCGTCGAAE
jgi:hypothetical protein